MGPELNRVCVMARTSRVQKVLHLKALHKAYGVKNRMDGAQRRRRDQYSLETNIGVQRIFQRRDRGVEQHMGRVEQHIGCVEHHISRVERDLGCPEKHMEKQMGRVQGHLK